MPRIPTNISATIGRTPLVELRRMLRGTAVRLFAKLECVQPGRQRQGPHRRGDGRGRRAGRGALAPGGDIVEATSGNTGIALAFVGATKGYTLHLTMPERMCASGRGCCALRRPGGDHADAGRDA